ARAHARCGSAPPIARPSGKSTRRTILLDMTITAVAHRLHRWLKAISFPTGFFCAIGIICGQAVAAAQANRGVYLDSSGVVRWKDDRKEVTLFGANYVLPTASDYRAAGYLHADRKHMIDEDMAQFARMGWDAMRLTFWGDWEASDSAGNLIPNEHLDLQDY